MNAEHAPKSLASFIAEHGITMTVSQADRNPHMVDDWRGASHWRCTIKSGTHRMVIWFSMGGALTGPPTLADVLDALASDASSILDGRTFEDWCGDYGYDTDSRKAERTYKACQRQTNALVRVLGDEAAHDLAYNVERL